MLWFVAQEFILIKTLNFKTARHFKKWTLCVWALQKKKKGSSFYRSPPPTFSDSSFRVKTQLNFCRLAWLAWRRHQSPPFHYCSRKKKKIFFPCKNDDFSCRISKKKSLKKRKGREEGDKAWKIHYLGERRKARKEGGEKWQEPVLPWRIVRNGNMRTMRTIIFATN